MSGANTIAVALDRNDEPVTTLVLTEAELLIVRWYRGDRTVTGEQLEAAIAMAAGRAKHANGAT